MGTPAQRVAERRWSHYHSVSMPTLKELRESRALAQRDLARIAGVAESTIVELEKRRRRPLPSTRRKLARALKVRPLDIDFS